jgi:hypothetical protein
VLFALFALFFFFHIVTRHNGPGYGRCRTLRICGEFLCGVAGRREVDLLTGRAASPVEWVTKNVVKPNLRKLNWCKTTPWRPEVTDAAHVIFAPIRGPRAQNQGFENVVVNLKLGRVHHESRSYAVVGWLGLASKPQKF